LFGYAATLTQSGRFEHRRTVACILYRQVPPGMDSNTVIVTQIVTQYEHAISTTQYRLS
jgi:hypothetical protein